MCTLSLTYGFPHDDVTYNHVPEKCKSSQKATLWTAVWFGVFCACVCMASQPVVLEHLKAIAFLNCGWWSVGTHSGHKRPLYGKHLPFLPFKMFEMVWVIMANLLSHVCINREHLSFILVADPALTLGSISIQISSREGLLAWGILVLYAVPWVRISLSSEFAGVV